MCKQILSFPCLFGNRISSLDFPKHLMTLNPWPPCLLSWVLGLYVHASLLVYGRLEIKPGTSCMLEKELCLTELHPPAHTLLLIGVKINSFYGMSFHIWYDVLALLKKDIQESPELVCAPLKPQHWLFIAVCMWATWSLHTRPKYKKLSICKELFF